MEECPNPQLLAWVKEWLDTARERNSKGFTTYRNAYESLKACPLVFQHPAELQQLKGFGPKLCERLTDQLQKHCQENHLPMPEHPQAKKAAERARRDEQAAAAEGAGAAKKRKTRQPKAYVPAFRSGAYALLIGLSTQPDDTTAGMTKADLIQVSQPHCDSSFTAPSDPTKFYTAWASMKILVQKELVYERGRPLRRYALTDEGWEVANRIKETSEWKADNGNTALRPATSSTRPVRSLSAEIEVVAELDSAAKENATDSSLPAFAPIKLPPGSFSVRLVLDVREVRAKTDRDYMQEELAKLDATPLMRSLEVGDAQWVAKCHDSTLLQRLGAEGDEVVLDWIVERKRLDDLIGSIKDGRFHEQKFRLRRCGVQNVIYIIEDITIDPQVLQRYEEAVQSAIASTQVVNGYFVKRTSKMDETVRYLSRLTAMLKRRYEKQTLHVIPSRVITAQNYAPMLQHLRETEPSVGHYITYQTFSSLASKSEMMTLRDVFLKMLMTTRGVTGERALEIQRRWRTPHDFVKAFEACGPGETGKKRKRELVSSQLGHLVGRKKISKALSQKISEIWGDA
ncbi:Crossover junction endonuclease [Metarhizium anisopliae BRIP 53293]|uniref:Crossover junction endonuclease MUS81 n=1 Tax=Metarhizium anisopliae BRIP 53293 TaxID=1291518 RepID=A0A0D9NXH9_METAN|nr:Crossover junction endonuclease [Metarhizium anisopliae BRIP 53293]KJK92487.1 Crossover junction endonuclease [Metarhizium anisopliae BRIP 53284]